MDCLCLKAGIRGIAPSISVNGSSLEVRTNPSHVSAVVGRCSSSSSAALSTVETSLPQQKTASSSALPRFSLRYPLRSLWPGGGRYGMALDDAVLVEGKEEAGKGVDAKEEEGEGRGMVGSSTEDKNGNWVLKILNARPLWNGGDAVEEEKDAEAEEEEKCDACKILDDEEEEEENIEFNRESFSKLLRRVTLTDARLYAQMSHLGNLAYCIPKIKRGNLLRYYGLRFITSSIEKKELVSASEFEEPKKEEIVKKRNNIGYQISASAVYDIAASSASYLFSQSKIMLPFKSSKAKSDSDDSLRKSSRVKDRNIDMTNSEMTSLMATTDSVTAVIAAKEEVKQAVADNLNSVKSSPCEWFICDDDQSSTRFFAIQGSESLASWQANLLFEPIQFERLDVIVHRGIYEAAKGIYEQMLPEIRAHLESHGPRSMFRFTGHSLGGSLALLVNLMLLIRGQVPASSLLPVVTFGAPSIMCGGDLLLQKLGLPQTHVQSVMMHRDIVTRAFSCKYPDHIAKLLKAINGNFRNHPCLNNQKLLYAPMGELLILQPDEKFSPHHELLPSGSGLYLLTCPLSDSNDVEKQLRVARMVFLNTPHPLEMLSDRSAYGSDGTIQRDHDVNSYLKSVRGVIRQELNRIRKAKREHQRKVWWLLVGPCGVINPGIILERGLVSINLAGQHRFDFSRVVHSGRETVKRLSQLVAFQHMHLFVVLLLPARLILLKACGMITSSH